MEITRFADLRPRFVWDIVDDAFDLYRERFALLCGISAAVNAPAYLLYILVTASAVAAVSSRSGTDPFGGVLELYQSIFLGLPLLSIAQVLQGGATALVVQDVLEGKQENITLGSAYRRVFRRALPIMGAAFLVGFAVLIGLCAFGVGALYAGVVTAFVSQCILLEGRSIGSAFQRSHDLAQNAFGKVLGMNILVGLITAIISGGLQGLTEIFFVFIEWGENSAVQQAQKYVVSQSLTSIVAILLAPIASVALTLLYFDLRVRREGLDIAEAAKDTGYELAPDPFGDISSERVVQQMRRAGGKLGSGGGGAPR